MRHRRNLPLIAGCLLALSSWSILQGQQQLSLLIDSFNYLGWSTGPAPMSAKWMRAGGDTPEVVTNSTWIQLNNGAVFKSLHTNLSTDFEISVDLLPAGYSTAQWFGLFDATGSHGYGFCWDSSSPSSYGSQGFVSIQKYSGITNNTWQNQGKTLGSTYGSGHNAASKTNGAISPPFAHVVLVWTANSHTLFLFLDGALIASVVDKSFSSFSTVYLGGNGGTFFDNLSVKTTQDESAPFGVNVLTDTMSYTGWSAGAAPMNAAWSANSSTPAIIEEAKPNPPATNSGAPNLSSSYISLNNGLIYRTLSHGLPLTSNFSLAVDVLQTTYERAQWVGLFDASGTNGYAFAWDSSQSTNYSSSGIAEIRKCTTGGLSFAPPGLQEASAGSGHNKGNTFNAALTPPFAHFVFTWTAGAGTLTLSVDGANVCTWTDPDPLTSSPFTRLYIGGNSSGLFTNLSLGSSPGTVIAASSATGLTGLGSNGPPCGATEPFVTYEAERAALGGGATVTSMNASNLAAIGSQDLPVTEASGRAYVSLNARGQSLAFKVTQPANAIVIRHNVPYGGIYSNKTGPGATLHLWVNKETRARQVTQIVYIPNGEASKLLDALSLSSYHNESSTAYWEETRALVSGPGLKPGDTLKLVVGPGDAGTPYNIDSIDLEDVPAALTQPPNTYSVMTYGAYGDGVHDDTRAIQSAINLAQANRQGVWIPPGIYNQSAQFSLSGVKIYGAGMWYTNLVCIYDPQDDNWNGYMGFSFGGNGDEVHDLAIDSAVHVSRTTGGKPFISGTPPPTNWVVQNVWITHSIVGFWMENDTNGLVTGCRVRFTYADGIHLDGNCNHDTITNCHVRGAGDDGIAVLSTFNSNYPNPSHDNTVSRNTVMANWSASNIDLAGGYNNVIANNYLADSDSNGSLVINMPSGFGMYNTTGATITGNTIVRGGGDLYDQQRGAIWLWPNYGYPTDSPAITGVTFSNNLIRNSLWRGIQFSAPYNSQSVSITFTNNTIGGTINPDGDGIDIDSGWTGSGTFSRNSVSVPRHAYKNSAVATFKGSGSGNLPAFSFP